MNISSNGTTNSTMRRRALNGTMGSLSNGTMRRRALNGTMRSLSNGTMRSLSNGTMRSLSNGTMGNIVTDSVQEESNGTIKLKNGLYIEKNNIDSLGDFLMAKTFGFKKMEDLYNDNGTFMALENYLSENGYNPDELPDGLITLLNKKFDRMTRICFGILYMTLEERDEQLEKMDEQLKNKTEQIEIATGLMDKSSEELMEKNDLIKILQKSLEDETEKKELAELEVRNCERLIEHEKNRLKKQKDEIQSKFSKMQSVVYNYLDSLATKKSGYDKDWEKQYKELHTDLKFL